MALSPQSNGRPEGPTLGRPPCPHTSASAFISFGAPPVATRSFTPIGNSAFSPTSPPFSPTTAAPSSPPMAPPSHSPSHAPRSLSLLTLRIMMTPPTSNPAQSSSPSSPAAPALQHWMPQPPAPRSRFPPASIRPVASGIHLPSPAGQAVPLSCTVKADKQNAPAKKGAARPAPRRSR
jgi:hypothetical protein